MEDPILSHKNGCYFLKNGILKSIIQKFVNFSCMGIAYGPAKFTKLSCHEHFMFDNIGTDQNLKDMCYVLGKK